MLSVAEFLATLPSVEFRYLARTLADGLDRAKLAPLCLTAPEPRKETVVDLLEHLSEAIRQLEYVREVVRRRA